MLAVVRATAAVVFVPLTIGGGIKDTTDPDGTPRSALEVAGAYTRCLLAVKQFMQLSGSLRMEEKEEGGGG